MSSPADLETGQLAGLLAERKISAVEVLQAHLERIERLNGKLNAVIRLDPSARQQAEAADRRLAAHEGTPLTGIPVAIKDNLATKGLETSCCSEILNGFTPLRDATAIARLRLAGAVILGKTNMDEFGMGSSTENSIHGPTRNPWDPDLVAGGSSGGSAVAVATGMAPLALGSDTGGSVRQPAAFCGVVGLKPSYGRISRSGLVAFGSSLDQIGPLSRTVAGTACLLEATSGLDPLDATSSAAPTGDFHGACGRSPQGLRIGLPREYLDSGLAAGIRDKIIAAADALARSGASLEEISLPHTRYAVAVYYLIATAEASSNLARYDGVRYGIRVDDDTGLTNMYAATRGRGFGPEVKRRIMLGTFALSAGYQDEYYGKAQRARALLRQDFMDRFREGFDLILTPTTPTTAFRLGEKLDDPLAMDLSDIYTTTASLAGLPAMSVPVGLSDDGHPIGAQLIGREFDEESLLRAGSCIEHTSPPETLPAMVQA
jgi:aspartyl-tRNA(Asn)/glutamyl-tRNA(Gln) amidotransferase subunit A